MASTALDRAAPSPESPLDRIHGLLLGEAVTASEIAVLTSAVYGWGAGTPGVCRRDQPALESQDPWLAGRADRHRGAAGGADERPLRHTGMVECGVCGGTIVQTWHGRKPAYRCSYNRGRGRAVCANALAVDMHLADDTVLQAISRDVLDPEVVGEPATQRRSPTPDRSRRSYRP